MIEQRLNLEQTQKVDCDPGIAANNHTSYNASFRITAVY